METMLSLIGCGLIIISLGFVITFWFRAMFAFDKKIKLLNGLLLGDPAIAFFWFTFVSPQWVKENPEAATHLRNVRKFALFWNIGIIAWFFFLVPAITIVFSSK